MNLGILDKCHAADNDRFKKVKFKYFLRIAMHRDSKLRDNDANPPRNQANFGVSPDSGRRQVLTTAALGAAAMVAPSLLGRSQAAAQKVPTAQADGKPNQNKELSGKTAFITGGARGIGLATAEELAKAGANIVLYDVASRTLPHVPHPVATENDLEQAKAQVEALDVRCLAFKGDVRDREAQVRAMEQAVNTFGSLDIAVANAGVSQAGAIEEYSDEEISTVFEINVAGAVKTTQAAVRFMQPQGSGRIIFISSALGRMGNELFPIYASTKWAMIGFAKSAALSYGQSNILCNIVAPGLVDTPFADNDFILSKMLPDEPNPTFQMVSEMSRSGNPISVGHLEPIDVAKAVLFFAGSAADKITGEVLDVSYGSLARSIA